MCSTHSIPLWIPLLFLQWTNRLRENVHHAWWEFNILFTFCTTNYLRSSSRIIVVSLFSPSLALGPSELDNFTDELRGVIPRCFEYLFFLINREVERVSCNISLPWMCCKPLFHVCFLIWCCVCSFYLKSSQSKSFLCKCSFIEIYNEQIYDLLDTASASLFLRENIKKGVFVEGAVEKFVNSAAEAYQVYIACFLWLIEGYCTYYNTW